MIAEIVVIAFLAYVAAAPKNCMTAAAADCPDSRTLLMKNICLEMRRTLLLKHIYLEMRRTLLMKNIYLEMRRRHRTLYQKHVKNV